MGRGWADNWQSGTRLGLREDCIAQCALLPLNDSHYESIVDVVASVAARAERENGVYRVSSPTDPGVQDMFLLYCNVSVLFI